MKRSMNLTRQEEKKTITLEIGDYSEIFSDPWISQMFFENSLNTEQSISSESAVLNIFYFHQNRSVLQSSEKIKEFMKSMSVDDFRNKRKKLLKKLEELKDLYDPEYCVPTQLVGALCDQKKKKCDGYMMSYDLYK